ncbi:MAG TPA: surface-adhesin E family protein [Gemmatimonadaceae bacterium]
MIRFASRIAIIATLAVGTPLVAGGQSAPWRQVYKDADVTVIFDTANLALQSPGTWTTVTSWDYARPRVTEFKKPYTRLVERAYVRCSPVRIKRVRSTLYATNNVLVRDEGEVDSRDVAHMVWDRPKPGTAGRNAFETVCGVIARKSGGKAAPAAAATTKTAPKKATTTKKTTGT